jgi:hypothetical protein
MYGLIQAVEGLDEADIVLGWWAWKPWLWGA